MFNTDSIKEFTGLNDEQVEALVRTFHEELSQSNSDISNQLATRNWLALRKSIHTMRPGFIMFGLKEIDSIMSYLLDTEWSSIPTERIQDMVDRYLRLTTDLEKEIANKLT